MIAIEYGFEVASSMQHMNNPNGAFLVEIEIEDHVFRKAGNEYPT
jgi:hypothetical protein